MTRDDTAGFNGSAVHSTGGRLSGRGRGKTAPEELDDGVLEFRHTARATRTGRRFAKRRYVERTCGAAGGGPVPVFRTGAACLLAAAFVLLLGLAAPVAQAQTEITLVGNTSVTGNATSPSLSNDHAQGVHHRQFGQRL